MITLKCVSLDFAQKGDKTASLFEISEKRSDQKKLPCANRVKRFNLRVKHTSLVTAYSVEPMGIYPPSLLPSFIGH